MQSNTHSGLHVAIIMDGNGRWANRRGLPRVAGHRAGVATVRRIVERADEAGVSRLTLYAFSADNWRRPPAEVQRIFWLIRAFLRLETERMRKRGVRLQIIGRRDRLAKEVLREIDRAEWVTAAGRGLSLRVAIDYSSRHSITRAAVQAAVDLSDTGPPSPDLLFPMLMQALIAHGPDVDLLIRTGGEKRLSDFLLWECAYAELFFSDRMWPDFSTTDLDAALEEFRSRDRRFGAVPPPTAESLAIRAGGAP
jgi:undecaprenyl diphosphate synthase